MPPSEPAEHDGSGSKRSPEWSSHKDQNILSRIEGPGRNPAATASLPLIPALAMKIELAESLGGHRWNRGLKNI